MNRFTRLTALLAGVTLSGLAQGQAYPTRSITWVVPFAAGQTSDVVSRVVATKLAVALKQPVVVENKPGANGRIAAAAAAKAAPDGYTVVWGSAATHGMNSALYKNLPYDPINDFVPAAYFGAGPHLVMVPAASPITTIRQLIEALKAKPGVHTVATANPGASAILAGFQHTTGTQSVKVPYKTNAAAFTDVIGGRVSFAVDALVGALPYVTSGKVRPLAISSATRSPLLPNVPTLDESGLPGFDMSPWGMLFVPRGTPAAIVARLNSEIEKIMLQTDTREILERSGYNIAKHKSPAELAEFAKSEHKKWTDLVRAAGIEAE